VEGSQRQVKKLLKSYLIIKPACMLDQALELQIKIMYAFEEQYSEARSRSMTLDLSQALSPAQHKDMGLQLKYRFLQATDTGKVVPIGDQSKSATSGAAEVIIAFEGRKGSGFEHCQRVTQPLAGGS